MIVLAREIAGGEEPVLPLLDVTVERNAFGRQLEFVRGGPGRARSWATRRSTPCSSVRPIIERTGPDVDVLARLDDGRVVAVRERNVIATAFHPELAGETRFHRLVADDGLRARRSAARARAGGRIRRAGRRHGRVVTTQRACGRARSGSRA